jgi:thymidylate synthase (FAD)
MSGSRCEYIKFRITGLDRGTAEQCLRHEIGTDIPFEYQDNYSISDYSELIINENPTHIVKNMASFRYIDKDGFNYATPKTIRNNAEANGYYQSAMTMINNARNLIKMSLTNAGIDEKQAVQDANFVLPRATETEFVIGFTPEALIHFCHKRLCTRAQEFIRELAQEMKAEVKSYNFDFAKELVPQCRHLLWCPEGKRCCGAAPTKQELKERLANE